MGQVKARVFLVKATENPQEIVAAAGRLCYAADTSDICRQDAEDAAKFIERVVKMGHWSVIEHAVFSFYIEGVSRAMTHQLVRHRLASYSQRSQRYVTHDDFDYIVPPRLNGKTVDIDGHDVDAVAYYNETMAMIAQRYAKINDALGRSGQDSNEDARYVLPNACETKIIVTMNARELLHFFSERLCLRAQWEIRDVAEQMLKLVYDVCPAIFKYAGPKCVRSRSCPEGIKTCGKLKEILQKYSHI